MAYYLASGHMTRELNDRLRIKGDQSLGRLVCTGAITALSGQGMINVINAVKQYDNWDETNDPYEEHDYGSFEVDGVSYIWKIDYYDVNYIGGVEASERNNTARCKRVLTIMRSDDY